MSPLAFLDSGDILTFNLEIDAAFLLLEFHLPDEHQHLPILKILNGVSRLKEQLIAFAKCPEIGLAKDTRHQCRDRGES